MIGWRCRVPEKSTAGSSLPAPIELRRHLRKPLIKLKRVSDATGCAILGKAQFLNADATPSAPLQHLFRIGYRARGK